MDTETLDKLYLEWSQFTQARNRRELIMTDALNRIRGGSFPGASDLAITGNWKMMYEELQFLARDALDKSL